MATYTTTEADNWIAEVWEPGVQMAAYEETKIAPFFKKLKSTGSLLHIPKHGNLTSSVLAAGSAGGSITATANTETEVTAQPKTIYVYTAVNDNVIARMMFDPQDTLRQSIEMCLAERVDVECATIFTDLVSNVVGGTGENIGEATLRVLVKKLAMASKSFYKAGKTKPALILTPNEIDKILGDPVFTRYDVRGGTDLSATISGWVLRAFGADFVEAGTVQQSSSAYRNALVLPDLTFGLAFNKKATVKRQEYLLEQRLVGWLDMSAVTIWEEYGGRYDTTINP